MHNLITNNMEIKKIKRGDRLQTLLLDLEVGDVAEVPYKFYSANTIRATATQLKTDKGIGFEVNARGEKNAIVTRVL